MKLNLQERLIIINILPIESNFLTLKIVRDLKALIGISEDEFIEFDIKQDGDQIKWNEKGSIEKEFEVGIKAVSIVAEELKKLDSENKLNAQMMSVYKKFVGE